MPLFAENDVSPGKTMVEGKIYRGGSLIYHQSIAALLTFSEIQRLRHRDESDAFPMLVVFPSDVVILIYQPETDTLVITQVMPWGRVAYFFVRAVLPTQIASIREMWIQKCYWKSLFG